MQKHHLSSLSSHYQLLMLLQFLDSVMVMLVMNLKMVYIRLIHQISKQLFLLVKPM